MFCENCGMEMEKARFCPGCGAEQKSVVTATSIPVSPVSPVSSAPAAPVSEPLPAAESPEVASIPTESVPVTPAPEAVSSTPAASIPAASVPVSAAPEAVSSTPAASIPAASVPVSEAVSSIPTANPAAPAPVPAAPQPGVVTNNGISTTVFPVGVSNSPTVVITDENKLKAPERKYTGGHIAICLITAAIMAGIAGMFAGLYFTLLWSIR